MILPVTFANVVAPHSREAWPLRTGDDVDFDAGPSASGVTAGTGTALGSARCVATFGAGVARRVLVARLRWRHYGITGITVRVTRMRIAKFFFFTFYSFFSLSEEGGKFRVSGLPHARVRIAERPGTGPEFYETAQRVVRTMRVFKEMT